MGDPYGLISHVKMQSLPKLNLLHNENWHVPYHTNALMLSAIFCSAVHALRTLTKTGVISTHMVFYVLLHVTCPSPSSMIVTAFTLQPLSTKGLRTLCAVSLYALIYIISVCAFTHRVYHNTQAIYV